MHATCTSMHPRHMRDPSRPEGIGSCRWHCRVGGDRPSEGAGRERRRQSHTAHCNRVRSTATQLSYCCDTAVNLQRYLVCCAWSVGVVISKLHAGHHAPCSTTLRVINLLLPYNCSASVVSCSAPISLSVDCGGANGPNAKLAQSGTAVSQMQLPVWHTANHTGTGLGHRQRLAVSSVCGPCLGLR